MTKVDAECNACGGTGLYCGMCEAKGVAVICLSCNGTGCMIVSYKPFEKRRGRRGVKTVQRSRGNFIATGVGPTGSSITYKEFKEGWMP